jgi:Putative DnaT-like ssDNA binding protein
MATITKETGTGSSSSTSYVSEADFTDYNAERAVTLGGTNGTPSEVLIKAMDYLESKSFIGTKNTQEQALQWPRYGAVVDGYYIDNDSIPLLLQEAQMEIAISIDAGTNPMANLARETIREKVDVIEVEYSASAFAQTYLTAAETKLKKLVKPTGMAYRV